MGPPPARGSAVATGVWPNVDLPLKQARPLWTRQMETHYATALLERCNNNVSAAAREACVTLNW